MGLTVYISQYVSYDAQPNPNAPKKENQQNKKRRNKAGPAVPQKMPRGYKYIQ